MPGGDDPPRLMATADADLMRHIRTIHAGSHGTYGAPRVHAELKADGLSVGRKRIARLMRAAGIAGVSRRRSAPITTRQATDHHPASDLVRRNFMAERPNELWVADITFLPTLAGFLYLAVVLDAWSRRIVGWAFSADLKTRVVLDALDMALVARKRRPSFVHHSRFAIHVGRFRRSLQGRRREAGVHRQAWSATPTTMRCARVSSPLLECELIDRRCFTANSDGAVFPSSHRRLLQSLTPPLGPRVSFAHRIRKET